jgi:Cofactor assembly of complex C subunit B
LFYWRKAKRPEKVVLKVEQIQAEGAPSPQMVVKVSAHRDELLELQRILAVDAIE